MILAPLVTQVSDIKESLKYKRTDGQTEERRTVTDVNHYIPNFFKASINIWNSLSSKGVFDEKFSEAKKNGQILNQKIA